MQISEAIRFLEQDDQYRVIQRLPNTDRYHEGEPTTSRIGIAIDIESTGLDIHKDKIIELGFVAFEYDAGSGRVYRVLHSFDGFEDPGEPLSDVVKQITGITDDMLKGQKLDESLINSWLEKADLFIAHNAAFDRPMLERRFPVVAARNWACTLRDVDWQAENIASLKLDYIAYRLGYYFDGHRAEIDARATLHLLTRELPESHQVVMQQLLAHARETSVRIFAVNSPFDSKDTLRARGYQWLPGYAFNDARGNPRKGVWSKAVPASVYEDEMQWLQTSIYHGKADQVECKTTTAVDRYSLREFQD